MAWKLIAAVGLVWLGWQIVSTTAASNLAESEPETALAWNPEEAAALVRLAEERLALEAAEPGWDSVSALARRALQENPLEAGALRLIALVAEAEGNTRRAEALMGMAGARSLRDAAAHGWLLNRRLLAKDFARAVDHVDAMLRVWPELRASVLPVLTSLAVDAHASQPLVDVLRGDPPWRRWFVTTLPQQVSEVEALHSFYSGLRSGPHPPTAEEVRAYLLRLIELDQTPRAFAAWVDFLPADHIPMLGNINNGGFEYPLSGQPFDWVVETIRGARTEMLSANVDDRALRVEFYNTQVPYRHVSQLLLLRPGSYRLLGEAKSVELRNERGLQWTLSCAAGSRELLGETNRVNGSRPWTPFELAFEVPARADCQAQVLRLVLAARIPAEQEVSGEVWYNNFRITRLPETGPS